MGWGNPRTSTAAWKRLRRFILARDHGICYVCGKPGADQVDHRDGNHHNDDPANLAAIHDDPCHRRKSSAEGHAAKRRLRAARRRPVEPHPGEITRTV